MSEHRQALEAALADKPFDLELRRDYARTLNELGDFATALKQWSLLFEQRQAAESAVGAARACLELEDRASAASWYEKAKRLPDFVAATEIETRLGTPAGLRVLSGGATKPDATVVSIHASQTKRFADVVGMKDLKKTIRLRIIEPFLNPGLFSRFGKKSGGGILLYGPPGCGKTLIARAIAAECNTSFIAVGISDILNMWIGESERNLSALFEKARSERPAVLFFDELDALAYARSKASSEHTRTLVNEFLNQLDGMGGDNDKILVLAATNMPWDVDAAMKRPGRFDKQIFVPPPDEDARAEMFRIKLVGVPVEGELDYASLARACANCSGADVDGIVDAAKERVLGEIMDHGSERGLRQADLLAAAQDAQPSTLDWLRTARNLVKYSGGDKSYKDVEAYLKQIKLP